MPGMPAAITLLLMPEYARSWCEEQSFAPVQDPVPRSDCHQALGAAFVARNGIHLCTNRALTLMIRTRHLSSFGT